MKRFMLLVFVLVALALLFCFVLCGAATAASDPLDADVLQERFLDHFQSLGFSLRTDGRGHRTLEKNVTQDGGTETLKHVEEVTETLWDSRTDGNGNTVSTKKTQTVPVTREYARQVGGYRGYFSLDLNISSFKTAAELATRLTTRTFSVMQRERLALEKRAKSLDTVLNRPVRAEETRWPEGDGWTEGLRSHEETFVFHESEEGYLYGELSSLRRPALTAESQGKSRENGALGLVFWTDKCLFELKVVAEQEGFGNLEGKTGAGPRAMDLVREAYAVITGKELSLSVLDPAASRPSLVLEASPLSLSADGRSAAVLTAALQNVSPDLAKGQELVFSILPEKGHVPGSLSAETVVLDGDDPVTVTFTGPDAKSFPDMPDRATVRVSCTELGLEETVSLALNHSEGLEVTVSQPVLPAHPDYYSALTFSFGATGEAPAGQTFETVIRAASPQGRLLTEKQKLAGEEGSPELVFEALPGAENRIYYHYAGGPPQEKALEERVSLEIPVMGYREDVGLSIGIDLVLAGVEPLWSEALKAGSAIPFRARVEDRFHPDVSVKELFDAFDIAPDLRVIQKNFVPATPAGDMKNNLCLRLLDHVAGAAIPGGATVREVTAGVVLRGKGDDTGWYLAETSAGGGTFFPGVIPWDRGSYQFEAMLIPKWRGGAAEENRSVVVVPLEIGEAGSGDATLDDFFSPMLRSWAGVIPVGSVTATAWDVAVTVRDGRSDPKGAALAGIEALASSVVRDLNDGWAGNTPDSRLLKEAFRVRVSEAMKIPPDKLDDETFRKAMRSAGDRYWKGCTLDALFGYAVDRAKGVALSGRSETLPEETVSEPGSDPLSEALTFGSAFLKGSGGAAIILLGPGAGQAMVRDGEGKALQDAPHQMFVPGGELQRVYRSEGRLTVPVEADGEIVLEVPAGMKGLKLYCLRGDGYSVMGPEASEKPFRAVLSGESIVLQEMGVPRESLSPDHRDEPLRQEAPSSQDETPPELLSAAITGNRVNFRSEPTVSGKVLGKLDKGERVHVLKEWTPPVLGEGILNEACDIEAGGEILHLPNGFGVAVTALDERSGSLTVTFPHRGEKVSGRIPRNVVSSTKGSKWYRIRRDDGTEGWAFGKYVDPEEGPPPGPGPDVQYLYYQALDLLNGKKDGEALFKLDQVLELYPAHVDALFERGKCLAAAKRYEEALESFWEIPFYAPSHPQFLAWTGYCYQAMERYDRAMLAYAAVLRLHPLHAIAGPVSDHIRQCRKLLNLPEGSLPSEADVKGFIFKRWDASIAGDIWKGSTRGKGLWDSW